MVLIQVLRENVSALSVRLTPLVSFGIEKGKPKDTLPELVHHIDPQQGVDLLSFEIEKRVNFRQLAEEVAAGVSSSLFKTGRDGTKLSVPGLTLLIA